MPMNEEEQEDHIAGGIKLPIEWHVPETLHNQYVHNVIVQPGAHEITLFFFETQIPPFIGTPEENRDYFQKQGSVRFECISKMTLAPQLIPDVIKALQVGLDNYNAAKANTEKGTKNASD
jgi:hypothetical protein